jgi:hypothetical protein
MTTISEQLKIAALRGGMIDPDDVALADTSKHDGTAERADQLVAALKAEKPHLFRPKMARDMSQQERETFLRNHKRKFNL